LSRTTFTLFENRLEDLSTLRLDGLAAELDALRRLSQANLQDLPMGVCWHGQG